MNTAITILTLAIFITFASGINQNNTGGSGALVTAPGIVETFSNNSILGNGTNGCVGCTPSGPGN